MYPHVDKLDFSTGLLGLAFIGLAKELNLYGNQIGDIGAEKLAETLPNLTNLTVAWLVYCYVWVA